MQGLRHGRSGWYADEWRGEMHSGVEQHEEHEEEEQEQEHGEERYGNSFASMVD